MSSTDDSVENFGAESNIPFLSLSNFYGGNHLPTFNILNEDLKIEKSYLMVAMLLKMWEEKDATDLTLTLGTKQMQCNRLLFLCHSEYGVRNLMNGCRELVFSEDQVTWEGLEGVCKWMVEPERKLERRHIFRVLTTALFLEMKDMITQIWHCLNLSNQLIEDQAFVVSQDAQYLRTNLPVSGLDTFMLRRVKCFFLTVVGSPDFLQLSLEHICCLLSSNNIAINNEVEVLYAAVLWLSHDRHNRSKHVETILSMVRFLLLPRKFIVSIRESIIEPALIDVFTTPEFQKLINEAYGNLFVVYYDDNSVFYRCLIKVLEISVPQRRLFICDNRCPYHRHYSDPSYGDISYNQFLSYVRLLQNDLKHWKSLHTERINFKINYKFTDESQIENCN